MITVVSFIIVLGILVFFHELGHYWVARRNGIAVEEFGMGYPPRLVKLFTYDGTDFTINLIPFGGFARMSEDSGEVTPGSFNAASKGARAMTLFAGPLMNGLLAVVLFAASFMAGFPAVVGYAQVTTAAAGSPAAALGIQSGDVLLSLGDKPVQISAVPEIDYEVMERGESAGGGENVLRFSRGDEIFEAVAPAGMSPQTLLDGVEAVPVLVTQITLVADDTPAQEAGLREGDLVYSVGESVISLDLPLSDEIRRNAGTEVSMTVLRDGEWLTVPVTPRADPPPGQGALGVQIGPVNTLATLPLTAALWQGVRSTGEYISLVLQLPVLLLMGQMEPADAQLTGPVGIAQMVGGAVNATLDTGLWFPIFRLSAILSAALAITNLLPLPALDGGRLLFIAFETLRGRRVNPEREGLIHMVGFMLLLGLLVLITVRDITTAQQGIDWATILGE